MLVMNITHNSPDIVLEIENQEIARICVVKQKRGRGRSIGIKALPHIKIRRLTKAKDGDTTIQNSQIS